LVGFDAPAFGDGGFSPFAHERAKQRASRWTPTLQLV
jgi:hypothetical protein